jgi:GDP-mannose 6-dehydrogenase
MRISVFGLGYVGVVSAACLARDGHHVVGVDPQEAKVRLIGDGRTPIVEQYVAELIEEAARAGTLTATTDAQRAVAETEASLVCVGTPSRRNGALDVTAVERVCEQIGAAIRDKDAPHLVVMRSTILPGTMRGVVIPALERASGLRVGETLQVANNPEFLRESTAVYDYDNPPKTVVGATSPETAERVLTLYENLPGPKIATEIEVAELVKYADNAWHAVKVAFGNEIGNIAKAVGVDSWKVMDIFCQDEKLNLSPYYLKPGFAFGGSCLPKDVRALTARGRELDLRLPLLESLIPTNEHQIARAMERVTAFGRRKVAFLGVSFKAGTDDLRESPQIALVERLIGKGYDLRIYDRNVHLARLTGANRDYIVNVIPHISEILSDDLAAVLDHGEIVVIGNPAPEFRAIPDQLRADQILFDLARIPGAADALGDRYEGVNW